MENDYPPGHKARNSSPRWANVVLGAWLFASAFLWDHSPRQFNNSWVVGVAIIVLGAMAIRFSQLRFANTALAVWLSLSVWALPTASSTTVYNNVIVAVAIFFTSMTPNQRERSFEARSKRRSASAHR